MSPKCFTWIKSSFKLDRKGNSNSTVYNDDDNELTILMINIFVNASKWRKSCLVKMSVKLIFLVIS